MSLKLNICVNCVSFGVELDESLRRIVTPVKLVSAHFSGEKYTVYADNIRALWDTGASASTISHELADKLGLPCVGEDEVMGAGGSFRAKRYLAGLILTNHVVFPHLMLSGFVGSKNIEMLIGMDVIGQGDFLVSGANKKIYFSFQHPSFGGFYLQDIKQLVLHNGVVAGKVKSEPLDFLVNKRSKPLLARKKRKK